MSARYALCLLALGFLSSTVTAVAEDYPVHLRVVHVHNHSHGGWEYGDGEADLTDNGQTNGVMFQYSCNSKLAPSFSNDFYQARWKKPGHELHVAATAVGSTHTDFCDVKVDIKPYIFLRRDGERQTLTQDQFADWKSSHPDRTF